MKPFVDPDLRSIDPPLFVDPSEPYLDESDIAKDCFERLILQIIVPTLIRVSPLTQLSPNLNHSLKIISVDNESIFRAEKILKRRKRKRKTQYLVVRKLCLKSKYLGT